jgi:hypothetical protein
MNTSGYRLVAITPAHALGKASHHNIGLQDLAGQYLPVTYSSAPRPAHTTLTPRPSPSPHTPEPSPATKNIPHHPNNCGHMCGRQRGGTYCRKHLRSRLRPYPAGWDSCPGHHRVGLREWRGGGGRGRGQASLGHTSITIAPVHLQPQHHTGMNTACHLRHCWTIVALVTQWVRVCGEGHGGGNEAGSGTHEPG